MPDRPSTSTSKVRRPRSKSMHQTSCILVGKPKVGRPRSKSAHASKTTDSSIKPKGKKAPGRSPKHVKVVTPTEKRVIEIDSDNSEKTEFHIYPLELPDLPPVEVEQPNEVPNQPLDAPVKEPNQPLDTTTNQIHLTNLFSQINPPNLPNPMANQQLNWSYFKPEFACKAEEDVEAHLLRTNDWMDTHNFPDDQKVRRFFLTLTSEARLWYEAIRQVQLDWPMMQEHFRHQYSKFGNTREQYFMFGDLSNLMKLQIP